MKIIVHINSILHLLENALNQPLNIQRDNLRVIVCHYQWNCIDQHISHCVIYNHNLSYKHQQTMSDQRNYFDILNNNSIRSERDFRAATNSLMSTTKELKEEFST